MVTRICLGTHNQNPRYNCHVSTISPLLKSYKNAINDLNWQRAMLDEYDVLIKNDIRVLVPRPPNANIVRSMWLLKHKYFVYGTLSVASGNNQQIGVDYDDTFSQVVKPTTIRTILSLAASRHQHVHQLDFKNTFLHAGTACLVLAEFSMTDLGSLNYFFGIFIYRTKAGMFLCQKKYVSEILERVGMRSFHSCRTPVDTNAKIRDDGSSVSDPTLYRSFAGALQYLTFTCPDLSYVVQSSAEAKYRGVANVVAETSWLRNLLCKLHSQLHTATIVYLSSDPVLQNCIRKQYCRLFYNFIERQESARKDVERAFGVLQGRWGFIQQPARAYEVNTLRRIISSAEAKYRGVANVVAETFWLRNLLCRYLQYADIFTKDLPFALFDDFHTGLGIRRPPAPTARGC
ncbi:ribonuclease H-like domain-containing protein [Tanacetum coccineum]